MALLAGTYIQYSNGTTDSTSPLGSAMSRNGAASWDQVGSYSFAGYGASTSSFINDGTSYAGSSLRPAGWLKAETTSRSADQYGPMGVVTGTTALSGTWRAYGRVGNTTTRGNKCTLFLRIS